MSCWRHWRSWLRVSSHSTRKKENNTDCSLNYCRKNNWKIGPCLACVYRVMDAREKFVEHKRSVRVSRGAAESNSSFLSTLQIPKCIHNSIYAQLKTLTSSFITSDNNLGAKTCFSCDWLQSLHNARWRKTADPIAWLTTHHNQLGNSSTKTLHLVSKIANKKLASSN